MIIKTYPDPLSAWHGLVDTLAYRLNKQSLKWGSCLAYPSLVSVEMDDLAVDTGLHLNMPGFTKGRWKQFLREYCRPDVCEWIGESLENFKRYPERPFVAGYDFNPNVKHKYGACLSSFQIRLKPQPAVIVSSRASQLDKAGFLDLVLMHLVAKEMVTRGIPQPICGLWNISLAFINCVGQLFYLKRFDRPLQGHGLEREIAQHARESWEDAQYGPHRRALKRNLQLDETGDIPGSVAVRELSLQFDPVPAEEAVDLFS